ncbi:DUF3899 domain-containing protein [Rossellomorea marisflavi]|jgi:Domain of unknown function (DUF3899)|uniref:DUF3899 domain-containing protein n=1 Tax=Rossellomorea marisflavi TaxID=189381 RepID=UPI002853620D|nr:DUF3899 domain-containing protein [Rossellomorea marisflavi]MDR4934932.1 DUF3899 domain-containing protein [Rossellomorea marisflavi]
MKWNVGLMLLTMTGWSVAMLVYPESKMDLTDSSFLVGLSLLIVAVSCMILKSGFLTPVSEGFKIIGERMIRKSRAMGRADELIKKDHEYQAFKSKISSRITQGTFTMGICSILFSLAGIAIK